MTDHILFNVFKFNVLIYSCFTMLYQFLLYDSESAICTHISPLFLSLPPSPSSPVPPVQVITEHQAKLPVPYSRVLLAVCLTHGSEYMSIPISQPPHSPAPCPHVCYLHLHLYSCPADRFICTIFLDSLSCVTSGQSLSSLCFSFLLCKMGRIILLALLRLSRVSAGTILIAVAFTLGSPVQGPVINS